MRLDRYLSHAGYGSRNDVKKLIIKKRVRVNEEIVRYPSVILEDLDKVYVDDQLVTFKEFHYVLLNKPKGVISATTDATYKTVLDLLEEYKKFNLAPVGRLDMDTTGVLLMTNNGALAHFLISPKHHVKKVYLATVNKPITHNLEEEFLKGVVLEDGYKCLPAKIEVHGNVARITLEEGKYHQVKRMLRAFDYKVRELHREQFAFLRVDDLAIGTYRELNEEEIQRLISIRDKEK